MLKSFFAILFFSQLGFAANNYSVVCDKFPATLTGGFCLHIPEKTSGDLIYHLHGLGGSEFAWQNPLSYHQQVRDEWNKYQETLPVVISISFGGTWLLTEKNSSSVSGLFNVVTMQVFPMLEAKVLAATLTPIKRKILLGESMGGFNSIQLGLKTDLFQKIASICAPMATVSPFDSAETIQKYVEGTTAWAFYKDNPQPVLDNVKRMIQLSTAFFPTPADWAKGDPLILSLQNKKFPDFYINAGMIDTYALFETNELFAKQLKSQGANVEWHPMWGGHCTMDIKSLANFLIR